MDENINKEIEEIDKGKPVKDSVVNQSMAMTLNSRTLIGLILISMLAGMGGGIYSALSLANKPGVQKFFSGTNNNSASINQNLVLNEQSAITEVVKKTSGAVVSIIVSKELQSTRSFNFDPFGIFPDSKEVPGGVQKIGAGTGFFISDDGIILTNRHVVSEVGASYSVITNDGKNYDAKVLSMDPVNDLAIVKVEASNVKFLTFADSSKIELGQQVVAIGNSLGQYQNTVTSGIVSGIGRSIVAGDRTGSEQLEGVIQTDAAINPGNSGGPLLNLVGQVIGINTAIDQQGQLVGFAISSNDAKAALDSYQSNGRIVRPFMGVRYATITEALAASEGLARKSGALVVAGEQNTGAAVLPGSPAEKAGIRAGDIIISINGRELTEEDTLARVLKSSKSGETITVRILRGKEEISLPVILGEAQ